MANSVQNIPVSAPLINAGGASVTRSAAGNNGIDGENSSSSGVSFMDFVLARVTALQSDKTELNEITNPTSTVTNNSLLSTENNNSLLSVAKLLAPFDGDKTTDAQTLETIPEDAKAALKDLSAAILKMADKGLITLTDKQTESLTTLANLIVRTADITAGPTDEVSALINNAAAADTDENGNKNIVITVGNEKIVIPQSLIKFTGEETADGKQVADKAVENSNALSRVVAQLENIVEELSAPVADVITAQPETEATEIIAAASSGEENPEAIAAMFNEIAPSDSADEENNSAVEIESSENVESDVDEDTVVAALLTAITPDAKPTKPGVTETSSAMNVIAPDAGLTNNKSPVDADGENTAKDAGKAGTDAVMQQSGKSDNTAAKAGDKASSFAQLLNTASENKNSGESSLTSAADDMIADDTSILKNADALIQSDLKNSVLRQSATGQNSPSQQIAIQLHKSIGNGDSKFTVRLEPEELGEVTIRLAMSKDGKARATVLAEKGETLSMLMKDSAQLQKALNEAGLNASAEDLTFQLQDHNNNQAFEQRNNNNAGGSNANNTSGIGTTTEEFGIISSGNEDSIGEYRINYKV